MEHYVYVKVNGETAARVWTNHSMTIEEALYCAGYDITDKEDCKAGYEKGVPGFYIDDNGEYQFDIENAEMTFEK